MKLKKDYNDVIDRFDSEEKTGEDEILGIINGERDPKAEKLERFIKKPATVALVFLLLGEFIMLAVLLAVAGGEKIVYDGSIGLRGILNSAGIGSVGNYEKLVADESGLSEAETFLLNYTANESLSLSMLSPSFVSFVQHDYNVKHGVASEGADGEIESNGEAVLAETEAPAAKPSQTQETVTEKPTEEPENATSGEYKYYTFSLENYTYGVSLAGEEGSVAAGISSDNCTEKDLNVGNDDFVYGNMTIQNSHGAEGFDLRRVLSTPLKIPGGAGIDSERIMIYYTHTSEGYCTTEAEKDLTKTESVSSRDNTKNVVSCGNIIAEELEKKGVSVLNRTDINDEDYNTAYEVSGQLLKDVTGTWKDIDLAVDVHSDALEYPKGTRYSASTVCEGVSYAKMSFVITVGEENPHWQENIKLAMLLIDRLERRVPGITRGILLRTDGKYNSTVTEKGLLVEMGFEGNLVTEAQATAKVFGEVLGEIYG